jgi:hypothetical protein
MLSNRSLRTGQRGLPPRRRVLKIRVREPVQKVWPRHRRWVRSHGCCVPNCQAAPIEFAHVRSAGNAGTAQKPHDAYGVSLCRIHHDEQHRLGLRRFERKYAIQLSDLAARFTLLSPDWQMRLSRMEA